MSDEPITVEMLFAKAGKALRQDFERIKSTNPHHGERGAEVEGVLGEFHAEVSQAPMRISHSRPGARAWSRSGWVIGSCCWGSSMAPRFGHADVVHNSGKPAQSRAIRPAIRKYTRETGIVAQCLAPTPTSTRKNSPARISTPHSSRQVG